MPMQCKSIYARLTPRVLQLSCHMGEEWISLLMIRLHQTINGFHIAIAGLNWNLMTILYSKIAKVSFSSLTSMWLVHIVHAS